MTLANMGLYVKVKKEESGKVGKEGMDRGREETLSYIPDYPGWIGSCLSKDRKRQEEEGRVTYFHTLVFRRHTRT